MNSTSPNLIAIVVDGLHAGMVGAYGNSWIRTRRLDQLSSQSFLFDQAFVDAPTLEQAYRSMWYGMRAGNPSDPSGDAKSLPELLARGGWHTALITDDATVAGLPAAGTFAEQLLVELPPAQEAAEQIDEMQISLLLGAATQWLETAPQPFALWIHARGLFGPWDAPPELRERYVDEEDPEPAQFIEAPNFWLPPDHDPDELLGYSHAYAGQVTALDQCLAQFLDALDASELAAKTQLTFLSARGFALGEHLRVGYCDGALFNGLTQLVWMMQFPDGLGQLDRTQALAQPSDLPGTLLDWLGLDRSALGSGHASSLLEIIRGDALSARDRLCLISQHDQALRTPAWLLRQPGLEGVELYTKPADRWEVNEVGRLMPDVVSGLQAALAESLQVGEADKLPPLAEPLVMELD